MNSKTGFYKRISLIGLGAVGGALWLSLYQIQEVARAATPDISTTSIGQNSLFSPSVGSFSDSLLGSPDQGKAPIKGRVRLNPPASVTGNKVTATKSTNAQPSEAKGRLNPNVPAVTNIIKASKSAVPKQSIAPKSQLEPVKLRIESDGRPILTRLPEFQTVAAGRVAGISTDRDYVIYSLDPKLQKFTADLVKRAAAPHVAIVVMDPNTGRVLAMADKSTSIPELSLHAGFPAASLFKIVTSAAALEQSKLQPLSPIAFRGGNYTLDRWNALPNTRLDRRSMSLAEALGRSCNPVFARVALNHLSPEILRSYANAFGFNRDIDFDIGISSSTATIPNDDGYEIGRTAAGFGKIKISPVHAASIMSGIANGGIMPRPYVIDALYNNDGEILFSSQPQGLGRIVGSGTARELMSMMQYTTTIGTSHREFTNRKGSVINEMAVAAKTGTLRGTDPLGTNHWFLAAAPLNNPRIAVSVISIDPVKSTGKASYLGRMVMEQFFGNPNPYTIQPAATIKRTTKKKTVRRK